MYVYYVLLVDFIRGGQSQWRPTNYAGALSVPSPSQSDGGAIGHDRG